MAFFLTILTPIPSLLRKEGSAHDKISNNIDPDSTIDCVFLNIRFNLESTHNIHYVSELPPLCIAERGLRG